MFHFWYPCVGKLWQLFKMPEKTLENWEWRKMFFIELDEFPQFTEASVKIRIHRCTWQSRWKGHCKTWKDACSCSVHARIFSTKTAMTTSEEDDDASYWHAIFTKTVAKHLSSYSPGLTATPLYTFYDLLLKRNYRFFSRFASNNNSDYLHFPALFFCSRVSLSFESSPALHWCQIYRNKTDVQKYCSENWKKRERKSTQSHKNKYNCEVSQVNNGTSIKTAKLRRDFVSSSQLFCNLTHKKASFWWDYKK